MNFSGRFGKTVYHRRGKDFCALVFRHLQKIHVLFWWLNRPTLISPLASETLAMTTHATFSLMNWIWTFPMSSTRLAENSDEETCFVILPCLVIQWSFKDGDLIPSKLIKIMQSEFQSHSCSPCIWPTVKSLSNRSTFASIKSFCSGHLRKFFESPWNQPDQYFSVAQRSILHVYGPIAAGSCGVIQ